MPFFIKNQWLADRFYFIFESSQSSQSSQKSHPVLWITPIDHSNARKARNEIPAWQNLLDTLKQQDIQHLGVSITPARNKSLDTPAAMKLQVITHYQSGRQTTQVYPIEGSDETGNTPIFWDLELMSWLCLPHTDKKIYSLFDSRTIEQLAGLLASNTPGALKPPLVDITASERSYLLAQIKAGDQEPIQLGYSAYGHYVTLEPFGQSISELKWLLSGAQSKALVASNSKQQVVEWTRPLTMLLQASANYGAEKTGRFLVSHVDNTLFQDEEKVISESIRGLKKAHPVYLNKLWFLVLSSLMVSPSEIPTGLNDAGTTLTENGNGAFRNARKQNAPVPLTSTPVASTPLASTPQTSNSYMAVQPNRLVIEPEDSWAQSVFFAISSLGRVPGGPLPGSSVLYGSRSFAVGMQVVYGRFSSQIIPEDWDFMVEKNSLGRLLIKLGLPEEIKASFLAHQNKKSDLFEYTKEWSDGRKMSLKVLAYNIPAHDPKGIRITLHQPEGDAQHPEKYQFDLLLVESLPPRNTVFVPTRMDTSSFYCNTVALSYFLSNWEDMWSRLDRKALVKALPRIRYWLQEECLQQQLVGTDALPRLENLANQIQSFLLRSAGATVISFGESSLLNQEPILNAPSFDVAQNLAENRSPIPLQPDGSPERNDRFEKANNENEWFFLIKENKLGRALDTLSFRGMLLKKFSEENDNTLVFFPKKVVSRISFSGRELPKKILTSMNMGRVVSGENDFKKGTVIEISTTDKEYDSVDIYPSVYNLESSENYAPKRTVLTFQGESSKTSLTLNHAQGGADSALDTMRFNVREDEQQAISVKGKLQVSIDIPKGFLLDLQNSYIVNANDEKIYFDRDSSDVDTPSQSTSDHHDLMTLLVYHRNNEQITLGFVKSSSKLDSTSQKKIVGTGGSISTPFAQDTPNESSALRVKERRNLPTYRHSRKGGNDDGIILNATSLKKVNIDKKAQKKERANNFKPKKDVQQKREKKEKPDSLKNALETEVVALPETLLAKEASQVKSKTEDKVIQPSQISTATITGSHNKKTELAPRYVKKHQATTKSSPSKTQEKSSTPDPLAVQNTYQSLKNRIQNINQDIELTESLYEIELRSYEIELRSYEALNWETDRLIHEYHKKPISTNQGLSTLEKKVHKTIDKNRKMLTKTSNNFDWYRKKIKSRKQEVQVLSESLKKMEDSIVLSKNTVINITDKESVSDKELLSFFVKYSKFDEAYLLFLNFWSKPKNSGINSFLLKILEVAAWQNHDAFNRLLKLSASYRLDNNIAMLKTFRIFKMHGKMKDEQPGKTLIFSDNILQEILDRLLKNQVGTPINPQSGANHIASDYTDIWKAFVENKPYSDIQGMIEALRSRCDKNDTWLTLSLEFLEAVNHLEHGMTMAFPDDVMTTYLRWLYEPDVTQRSALMTRLKQLIPDELPEGSSNLQLPVEAVLDAAIAASDENMAEATRLTGLALQLTAKYQGLPADSSSLSKVIADRYLWGNPKALFSLALLLSDEPEYKDLSHQLLDTLTVPEFREERIPLDTPMSAGLCSHYWFNKYSLKNKRELSSSTIYMKALCYFCLTSLTGIEQYLCNNRHCDEDCPVFVCSECILKENVAKGLECTNCEKALLAMKNPHLKKNLKFHSSSTADSWRPLLSDPF